jgi:hypothetical protein
MDRRSFVQGLFAVSGSLFAGVSIGCDADESAPGRSITVRKSVSTMTPAEVDRFLRAYQFAVARGHFDAFNDEHHDHHKHRHHGADVLACSPMAIYSSGHQSAGYRLLPWHRAFILEAENMLRAALRARNAEEGKDPQEADLLYIPYWDAAHDQALPEWVLEFKPKGGTARVPPDLPKGHAGYGKAVGERYDIVFNRWPGMNLVFDVLHKPDQVGRALDHATFAAFYNAIDVAPEIVMSQLPAAKAGIEMLKVMLPDDPSVQTLASAQQTPPSTPEQQLAVTNALLALGYVAEVEAVKANPDHHLIHAVEDVYSMFRFMPHLLMHLWAGGLDPANPAIRGTVTYFQELTVDPIFWMLHTELDRYWYTWEKSHADQPALSGDDAVFRPLSAAEGAWYGGGKEYTLAQLTAHQGLPYRYDALFEV